MVCATGKTGSSALDDYGSSDDPSGGEDFEHSSDWEDSLDWNGSFASIDPFDYWDSR